MAFTWGEAHWQSAQDELTEWYGPADVSAIGAPRRRSAEQPVGTSSVAQDDIPDISMEDRRRRSAEQPVASSNRFADVIPMSGAGRGYAPPPSQPPSVSAGGSGGGGYILGFTEDIDKARKALSDYKLEVVYNF